MMFSGLGIAGGVAEFKKAAELDPNNAEVRDRYALNISIVGGMEQEALAAINRGHQLDPLSRDISYDLGLVHSFARQFDDAITVCKKLANENPTYAGAHNCLGNAYWGKHMYSESIEEWKAYAKLSGSRDDAELRLCSGRGISFSGLGGRSQREHRHPESTAPD